MSPATIPDRPRRSFWRDLRTMALVDAATLVPVLALALIAGAAQS